ncbi:MAG: hypothetical protein AAF682_26575 [Planctomycetota bacterium]
MRGADAGADWGPYIERLVAIGRFRGGSAFGNGRCVSRDDDDDGDDGDGDATTGFLRFEAERVEDVLELLPGNPVYEAGGSVEVHALVPD